jgi:alpha-L-fucosidase 2
VPSQSPENRFVGGIDPVSLTIGATMDFQLIHELLTNCISASKLLGVDAEKRVEWERILRQIPPLLIGKHGQLQEWLEDYDEVEPGHRHMSHLYALFPGEQITREKTPEFASAARKSIERRLAHEGGHTGWSRSWLVGLFARLGDGDSAEYHLRHLITDFATITLLDLHPPRIFQIDGNFGGTAGVAELLLQSHGGVIRLLPALPKAWSEGEVSGLAARGGVEVGIVWREGRAVEVTLKSRRGGHCRIQPPPGQKIGRVLLGNRKLTLTAENGMILLDLPAGKTARLTLE